MKKLKLELKNKIILILLLTFTFHISLICYADANYYNFIPNNGPQVLKDSSIVVTGDSFAGKFCDLESHKDLLIIGFARAGRTIDQNKIIMAEALNQKEQNVLISIGVNDQYMETPPYRFEYVMRSLLNISIITKKKCIFSQLFKIFFKFLW